MMQAAVVVQVVIEQLQLQSQDLDSKVQELAKKSTEALGSERCSARRQNDRKSEAVQTEVCQSERPHAMVGL